MRGGHLVGKSETYKKTALFVQNISITQITTNLVRVLWKVFEEYFVVVILVFLFAA